MHCCLHPPEDLIFLGLQQQVEKKACKACKAHARTDCPVLLPKGTDLHAVQLAQRQHFALCPSCRFALRVPVWMYMKQKAKVTAPSDSAAAFD